MMYYIKLSFGCLLIYFLKLNNSNFLFLINFLTSLLNNVLLIILIIQTYVSKISLNLCLNTCLFYYTRVSDVIGLHNTLFIYHPILLYISIIWGLMLLKNYNLKYSTYIYLTGIGSFILGGFWASQEFNWGGWWNWDALEMGVLFALILIGLTLHSFLLYFLKFNMVIYIFCYTVVYWICNKFGLTISIHSFITNEQFYLYNYYLYLVILNIRTSTGLLLHVLLITIVIKMPINFFFYKILICTALYFFIKKKLLLRIFLKSIHICIKYTTVLFFFLNYLNLTNYKTYVVMLHNTCITLGGKLISWVNRNTNILSKTFFYFKFKNSNYFTMFWEFQVKTLFGDINWVLII